MEIWRPHENIPSTSQEVAGNSDVHMISSDTENESQEFVPRRGNALKSGTRECILSCYDTLKEENHSTPIQRTAALLKISDSTVRSVIRSRSHEKTSQRQPKFWRATTSFKEAVVSKIYDSYSKNMVPTVKSVVDELQADSIEVPYKTTQFRLAMFLQRTV